MNSSMKLRPITATLFFSGSILLAQTTLQVQVKHLGAPSTRFNAPLRKPDDLRRMLRNRRRDVASLLKGNRVNWPGRMEDLEKAAITVPIDAIAIPPGETIPWMAMRRHGRADVTRHEAQMVWSGLLPLKAFTFQFHSEGRGWRLIAPQECGNFWIVPDDGSFPPEPGKHTVAECFHEDQQIQFAGSTAPYGRYGLIMHDNGDFGDTAQREGWYWLGVWIRPNLANAWSDTPPRILTVDEVLRKLEPNGDGVFVRAPGKDPFGRPTDGNKKHGMTRDQLVPIIAALSVWNKHDELQRLWNALPEDILGKHDFQGYWHDWTTGKDEYVLDPVNEIKNRSCSRHPDDTRDCEPHWGCDCKWYDLSCSKVLCELDKGRYKSQCELEKGAQNAYYRGEQLACEANKKIDVAAAVVKKETGLVYFRGDPLPPATYNLFLRAGIAPYSIFPVTLWHITPAGFTTGELNLKLGVDVMRHQAANLDYVDQDMNTIVMLWMSRRNITTPLSEAAVQSYRSRAHSYGSYYNKYCQIYGPLRFYEQCPSWEPHCCQNGDKDCLDSQLKSRIDLGIKSGWAPDGPGYGPYGAVRWYNRWSTKANPRLAVLWQPIIQDLVK